MRTNLSFDALNPFSLSVSYHNPHTFSIEDESHSHIHDTYEIYLNLSGNVSFMVENHTYEISRGNLIITRPFEYHHCIFHDNLKHEHYCLHFSDNGNNMYLKPFLDREKGTNNHIILSADTTKSIVNHFETLLKAGGDNPFDDYFHFFSILQLIRDNRVVPQVDAIDNLPPQLKSALDIIASRYNEHMTVTSLAEEIYISINTLERYFKNYLHISPNEYIKRKRLSSALSMLKDDITVSQVASLCGFSDTSNFIQIFKKSFGKTPYKYIKELRRSNSTEDNKTADF